MQSQDKLEAVADIMKCYIEEILYEYLVVFDSVIIDILPPMKCQLLLHTQRLLYSVIWLH